MTYQLPPPPSPQNDPYFRPPQPAESQGFNIAGLDMRKIARAYMDNKSIIKWGARLARQKIPPELDEFMEDTAYGRPISEERRQQFEGTARDAFGYDNPREGYGRGYPPPEGYEVPPNVIGEPVMTRQTAMAAWIMHHKEHMSLRDIEIELAKEGNPASRSTIARWINEVDEEMHFSQLARLKTLGKWAIAIGAWVFTVFLTHILF